MNGGEQMRRIGDHLAAIRIALYAVVAIMVFVHLVVPIFGITL